MKKITAAQYKELNKWIEQQHIKAKDNKSKVCLTALHKILANHKEQETNIELLKKHFKYNFQINYIAFRAIINRKKGKTIKLNQRDYNAE